jgi:hypothetical protein
MHFTGGKALLSSDVELRDEATLSREAGSLT